jgi:hypothetical protein
MSIPSLFPGFKMGLTQKIKENTVLGQNRTQYSGGLFPISFPGMSGTKR